MLTPFTIRPITHLVIVLSLAGIAFLGSLPGPALAAPLPQTPTQADIASYTIEVKLDPETKELHGVETIRYRNLTNAPIPDLVFHLYLNAFRSEDSLFLREAGIQHRGYEWDPQEPGWVQVDSIQLEDGTPLELEELEDGTLARAALPNPVPPGATVELVLEFRARLPLVFARTGWAPDAQGDPFFMAGQWFPKLGVWEAGDWNAYPFHANSEFYANFGTYEVSVTLPEGWVAGGTGMLLENQANGDGTQTVRFRAERVIDFAWTASPNFESANRQLGGMEIVYLYLPEHAWTVERALDASEAALSRFSDWFGLYPYPRLTIVDVPDAGGGAGGMEYPTLITAGTMDFLGLGPALVRLGWEKSLELVILHEIGHQWWQSMVAFNEAEEPWLDEGFTDYSTMRLANELYGEESSAIEAGGLEAGYLDTRRAEYLAEPRVAMFGNAWEFETLEYGVAAYSKPALSLLTLERTFGERAMLDLMGEFFRRYQFGHPDTEDFRAVAEEVTGQDLDWFFDGLVYGDGVVNYRVGRVEARRVDVLREGEVAIPTEVEFTFEDGSRRTVVWDGQEALQTYTFPEGPEVHSVEVDPARKVLVDLAWSDNGRSRQADLGGWLAVVVRLLYQIQNLLLALGGV